MTYQFQTGLQLWSREAVLTSYSNFPEQDFWNYTLRRLDKDSTVGLRWESTFSNYSLATRSNSPYYVDTPSVNYDEVGDVLYVTDSDGYGHSLPTSTYFNVNMRVIVEQGSVTETTPSITSIYPRFKMHQSTKKPVGGFYSSNNSLLSPTGRWFVPLAVEYDHNEHLKPIQLKIWTDWGAIITQGSDYDLILRSYKWYGDGQRQDNNNIIYR